MLYIDQPVQTGFSYDVATPGILNLMDGNIFSGEVPLNWTAMAGNFSSQDPTRTANTTAIAMRVIYHFLQIWFDE